MLIIRGAGLTGLASAARLARLGHDVTLETLGEPLGGAVPDVVAVPAAWRDLFKKSGGHLLAELNRARVELVEAPPRAHLLPDGTTLALPDERGPQYRAVVELFGEAEGARWRDLIDDLDDVWQAYRRHALEGTAPVVTARERAALLLDVTVGDLAARVCPPLAGIVLEAGGCPDSPALEALSLSVERQFGRWILTGEDGSPRPGSLLSDLLVARVAERGVTVVERSDLPADIDTTPPPDWSPRAANADEWLARPAIVGPDGSLLASAASPAGPAPWAQLGSAALAVYELHERLTGEDCRPSNRAFTMPRLRD